MKIALGVVLSLVAALAMADQYVNGYFRSDGTYVAPHYRSSPNSSRFDNYSTQGNTNPYTGQRGYVNPYSQPAPVYTPRSYNYGTQPRYRPYAR